MSRRNAIVQKPTPLWRCPKCGECFVTANMWHSCGKFSHETLFRRAEPHVVELFSVLHSFHVRESTDLDTSLQKWLHESYRVRGQERLKN